MFWIGLIIGFFGGGLFGVCFMALLQAGRNSGE